MNTYVEKIKKILEQQQLNGCLKTYEGLASNFSTNKMATSEEINLSNLYFQNKLPDDYKSFLKHYNGATLFQVEDIGGFRLFGVQELIRENKLQKDAFGKDWDENVILFCNSIGDPERIGFRIKADSQYEIIDCTMYDRPSKWNVIEFSFNEFLIRLIDEGGRKYWLD